CVLSEDVLQNLTHGAAGGFGLRAGDMALDVCCEDDSSHRLCSSRRAQSHRRQLPPPGFEVRAQARAFPYGIVLRTILVTYVWVKQICVQKLEGPCGVAPFPASNARLANFAKRAALVKIPNTPVRITPI